MLLWGHAEQLHCSPFLKSQQNGLLLLAAFAVLSSPILLI